MTGALIDQASPWVRSKRFDAVFVGGITGVALVCGAAVVAQPGLFLLILLLDIWLLGYHHVISTFTRLCADRSSIREHIGLLTKLPIIVLIAVTALGLGVGFWALSTLYLYWQWFHYTRQSWGIARVYERKSADPLPESQALFKATFWLLPMWGILHRSHQASDKFLGVDVRTIPVPGWLVTVVGIAAVFAGAGTVFTRLQSWRAGQLPLMHTLYLASHLTVFGVGYLLIDNIDHGWLVINIWHNAQYIAFTWHVNNRASAGVESPSVVQRLSARNRLVWYVVVSFCVSTMIYLSIQSTLATVVAPVLIYQTINFHHYVVDSRIWKVRKKPLQATLGLTT